MDVLDGGASVSTKRKTNANSSVHCVVEMPVAKLFTLY
jgi:hypothetical protein